jgi:hypothetical protein
MSMLLRRVSVGPIKLVALAALMAGALFAMGLAGSPAAHADQPPGPQSIIVGGGGQPTITTNKFFYTAGEWAQICYHVPGPGYVQITDQQGYSVKTLVAGYDNGAGDCFWGTVTPPFGQECLRIVYWFPYGGSSSNQTCFQVFPSYPFPY